MALVDGGVFTNLDLGGAILKCKDIVDKDEDIIVDIILLFDGPSIIEEWSKEDALNHKNAFEYA